jgi:hypothetical protein
MAGPPPLQPMSDGLPAALVTSPFVCLRAYGDGTVDWCCFGVGWTGLLTRCARAVRQSWEPSRWRGPSSATACRWGPATRRATRRTTAPRWHGLWPPARYDPKCATLLPVQPPARSPSLSPCTCTRGFVGASGTNAYRPVCAGQVAGRPVPSADWHRPGRCACGAARAGGRCPVPLPATDGGTLRAGQPAHQDLCHRRASRHHHGAAYIQCPDGAQACDRGAARAATGRAGHTGPGIQTPRRGRDRRSARRHQAQIYPRKPCPAVAARADHRAR